MRRLNRCRGRSTLAEADKRGGKISRGILGITIQEILLPGASIVQSVLESAPTVKPTTTPQALEKQHHSDSIFLQDNGQLFERRQEMRTKHSSSSSSNENTGGIPGKGAV